jgi:type IV secretory pathway component VirB8
MADRARHDGVRGVAMDARQLRLSRRIAGVALAIAVVAALVSARLMPTGQIVTTY